MKRHKHYVINKEKYNEKTVYLDKDKLKGFLFKPKNNVSYKGIEVNKMVIISPNFIETILKRKIKRKLDLYLQYIINLMDEADEDSSTSIRFALTDLERYKSIIRNNYQKYLDKKYIELLMKKIALIEHELKVKEYYINEYMMNLNESKGKGR